MADPSASRPRLLVLTSTLPRWANDSEPRFVLDLTRALAEKYDALILAPMAKGAAQRETINGVAIQRYRYAPARNWETLATPGAIMPNLQKNPWLYLLVPGFFIAQFIALVSVLRRESFDVIHCHWLIPQGFVVALASLFIRMPPVLITCHGADAFTLDFSIFKILKTWILNKASSTTVVSKEIAARLRDRTPKRLDHIPMGVDLAHFQSKPRSPNAAPVILYAGRLAAKKGVSLLLQAVADERIARFDARLRIIGNGPLLESLQMEARQLGLYDRVTFAGPLPHSELAAEMHAADIFCAPFVIANDGDREGTPTVLLEAAAAGLPIVTSDVGGCRDIIENGDSGWLLPPGDKEALVQALQEALLDPTTAAVRAISAHRRVHDFEWPCIAERYAQVLNNSIACSA